MLKQIKILSALIICVIFANSCIAESESGLEDTCRELISKLSSPNNIRRSTDGSIDFESGLSLSSVIGEEIIRDWNTPDKIETIISLVSDNDPYIRQMATISLGLIGSKPEVMTELISQLGNPDEFTSEAAYMAFLFMVMREHDEPMSIDEINQALLDEWSDDNLLLNMNIAYVVYVGVENPDILESLIPSIEMAFDHEDPKVRYCAARTVRGNNILLGEFMPNIIELLQEDDQKLKLVGMQALNKAYIYNGYVENHLELILPLLQDQDIDVRIEAATYVGMVSSDMNIFNEDHQRALDVFIELLQNQDPYYKFQAAKRIGVFTEYAEHAVPVLIEIFRTEDPDSIIRYAIMYALKRIGSEDDNVVSFLIDALHSNDKGIQGIALDSISMIGPAAKNAVPDLIALLHDSDIFTVRSAMDALGAIGPDAEAAKHDLLIILQDPFNLNMVDAGAALLRIDPNSEEAISVLEGLLNDSDSYKANSARDALAMLSQ